RALVASGSWSSRKGAGYYQGTYTQSSARGASLSLSGVYGRRLALVAGTCPECGSVKIMWNGVLKGKVSLAAPSTAGDVVFALPPLAALEKGTVRIVVTSTG